MNTLAKLFGAMGAINMAIAVCMGAFGAHGLKKKLDERMLEVFKTGVEYHSYHTLALFALAWWSTKTPGALTNTAGWLFVAGTILFSGSLYALALSGTRILGAITPLGGVCWIVAWVLLAVSALR